MDNKTRKIISATNVPLKVMSGHFATNHSHSNYYIDTTTLKTRQKEAQSAAAALAGMHVYDRVIDTIVCLDGMQVIGAYLAEELTRAGVLSKNAHQTLYVVTPEYNSNSQMIFRENIRPMIQGKNILILMAAVTSGKTIAKCLEGIQYYGGIAQEVSAIFSALDEAEGIHIHAVFTKRELPDYEAYDFRECPCCKKGIKIDALVNSFGYAML